MKVVALIPNWDEYCSTSDSVKRRGSTILGGESLISRTIRKLNKVGEIQDVVIFASSDKILNYIDKNLQFSFLQRDKDLDSNKTSIESIIERFLLDSDADIVALVHPKNPFIKPSTIQLCISKVRDLDFDSSFVATSIRKLSWYKEKRLNYSENFPIPPLSEVEPIIAESSSVYVFTRDLFNKYQSRIGKKPYFKEVGCFEGFEVGCKLHYNKGLEEGSEAVALVSS